MLGKTNMDEFGMGSQNFNTHHIPINPTNPDLIVGGSSGGAAVATKLNTGVVHFGTDTGGSITYPAH